MPRALTALTTLHKNQLENERPFIWLFELRTNDDPPRRFRLTNFTDLVEHGVDLQGAPLRYYPAAIVHSGTLQDAQSGLPSIELTIGANTPEANNLLSTLIDSNDGFLGNPVRIILISSFELDNEQAGVTDNAEVVSATVNNQAVGISVSSASIFERKFPPSVYSKVKCRANFGDDVCGYNLNASGAGFTLCGNTLIDCTLRGDDEEANPAVAVRQHPDRFDANAGIPRLRRT